MAVDKRCNLILRHATSIRHALDLQLGVRGVILAESLWLQALSILLNLLKVQHPKDRL